MTIRQFCIETAVAAPTRDNPRKRSAKGAMQQYRALKREEAIARNKKTPDSRRASARRLEMFK